MNYLSKNDQENLIHEIRRHPVLWNTRLKEYRLQSSRDRAYMSIAPQFGIKPEEVKSCWEALRAKYRREISRENATKPRSGAAGGAKKYNVGKWNLMPLFSFLKDSCNEREVEESHDFESLTSSFLPESQITGTQSIAPKDDINPNDVLDTPLFHLSGQSENILQADDDENSSNPMVSTIILPHGSRVEDFLDKSEAGSSVINVHQQEDNHVSPETVREILPNESQLRNSQQRLHAKSLSANHTGSEHSKSIVQSSRNSKTDNTVSSETDFTDAADSIADSFPISRKRKAQERKFADERKRYLDNFGTLVKAVQEKTTAECASTENSLTKTVELTTSSILEAMKLFLSQEKNTPELSPEDQLAKTFCEHFQACYKMWDNDMKRKGLQEMTKTLLDLMNQTNS